MSGQISVLNTLGRAAFSLGYEISPILMTGGIADQLGQGGILPIAALTLPLNILTGIIGGGVDVASAPRFRPLPGATLVSNEIGAYPFANQATAANAIIAQPLNISLLMLSPVNAPGGYTAKLATFMAMKFAFDTHNQQGGTYTVATPAFIYTSCIMARFVDVSGEDVRQAQYQWQLDFVKPLITQQAAQQALNTQMQKIQSGLQSDGSTSGPNVAATPTTAAGSAGALGPPQPLPGEPAAPGPPAPLPVPPIPPGSSGAGAA